MTPNQLYLIRCIAENRIQDAKHAALACCAENTTKKDAAVIKRCKDLLETGTDKVYELPVRLKGMAVAEDVSTFRADRYFLSEREAALLEQIKKIDRASMKLMEMGIPYLNSILLTGKSGTGKTMFGRYTAHVMNLPFLYINFSYLIDSYMGNTSKNLHSVFEWAKANRCLLMLDEIDAIARQRGKAPDATVREMSNTTITLLQELDQIRNDMILIGTTNIPDTLDAAVVRRFAIRHEVVPLTDDENRKCISQYLSAVGVKVSGDPAALAERLSGKTQSEVINTLIRMLADAIIEQPDCDTPELSLWQKERV